MAVLPASVQTAAQAVQHLQSAFGLLYEAREAAALVRQVVEAATGWAPHELTLRRHERLPTGSKARLNQLAKRIVAGEPLQYVLGWAPFLDLRLAVAPGVLIPRPETEELVLWAAETLATSPPGPALDVGTGSGAIAISLARRLPNLQWQAIDLSAEALQQATANALTASALVHFQQRDVLQLAAADYSNLRLLISNPPYVPAREASTLHPNVRDHEPHLALFVPDEDPIRFYRHLLQMGRHWLARGGWLFLELHPPTAPAVEALARNLAYPVVDLRHDLQGRPRMLRVQTA